LQQVIGPLGEATAAALKIGVASDPWTAWHFDLEGKPLNAPAVDDALQELRRTITILRAGSFERGVALWTRPVSSSSSRGTIRLVAIDKTGAEHSPSGASGDGKEECSPFNVRPADFARFEFRLRTYRHWVTFENLSLHPGKPTEVKIKVE
jgi:hypothetical protein